MEQGKIYTTDNIQSVWKQFAKNPKSIVWSDDNGDSWNEVPSMDTGKWSLFTIKEDGHRVEWIFKLKEKTDYRFDIDGIGIQFDTIYRKKIETGIQYQIKQLIGFWHSSKEYAYIIVYQRNKHNEFEQFPFHVEKVYRDGSSEKISVQEWEEDRKIIRR